MFCKKCGHALPDNVKFCPKCGNKVEILSEVSEITHAETQSADENDLPTMNEPTDVGKIDAIPQETISTETEVKTEQAEVTSGKVPSNEAVTKNAVPQTETPESKKSKKKPIIAAIIILLVLLVAGLGVFAFFKLRKTPVNLSEYLEIEYTGYDGYGTAGVNFDVDRFVKDYKGKIKPNKNLKKMLKDDKDLKSLASEYNLNKEKEICELFAEIYTTNGAIEADGNIDVKKLSNGDTFIYKWNIGTRDMDQEEAIAFAKSAFNVKLVAEDREFTVEGLDKIETFDAFEGVEVEFEGVSPYAQARIRETPSDNGLYYEITTDDYLKNGDSITVNAYYYWVDSETEYAATYNRLPESMTKVYTVQGLDEYVTDVSEITADGLNELLAQAKEFIEEDIQDEASDAATIENIDFAQAFLLTRKEYDYWGYNNRIVILHRVDLKFDTQDEELQNLEYYVATIFGDVIIQGSDGSLYVDPDDLEVPYATVDYRYNDDDYFFGYQHFSFYGYEDKNQLFDNVIKRNSDEYDCIIIPGGSEENVPIGGDTGVASTEDTEYVLAESSSRKLNIEELQGLTADQCRIARNEIYARHGRKFDDEELQSYFDAKTWYEGTIEAADFDESNLSEVEIANRDLIVEYETEMGYR